MSLFGNSQQTNGALNLGATSASPAMGANPFAPQGGMMQQMNQNPFMSGMAGGVGMQSGMMGQPMTPPSEMDIQLALMKASTTNSVGEFASSSI